jgi:hypothetical protein
MDGEEPQETAGFGPLDALGLIAGAALVLIVADILTDGRLLSRHLIRWRKGGEPVDPD